jgi:sortase A
VSEVREQVAVEAEPDAPGANGAVIADEAPPAERAPEPVEVAPADRQPAGRPASAHPVLRNAIIVMAILGALAGGFVLYEFWLTGLIQSRSQTHLLSQFKASLVLDDTPALVTPPQGQPVGVIEIPSIGVSQVMVQGISSSDTKLGPGHDPATPAPGQAGNAVVVGRRAAYGAPFAKLDQIAQGAPIDVLTRQGLFVYTAQRLVKNAPLGSPAIARQGTGTGSRLTLITSDPPYTAQQEIVVVAALKGKGLQAPGPLPLPPPGEHPGQTTNESQWGRILLWGELLAVAIGVTWYLIRRRWSTAVTYLLAAPILIALAFLFYGAVDTLLPPSL